MDIVSILITVAGIIIMVALYLIGRISQNKLPKEDKDTSIPRINDDYGEVTSSIREDIVTSGDDDSPVVTETRRIQPEAIQPVKAKTPQQVVLFIAAKEGNTLSGNKILSVLPKYQLAFGEMDLYHYGVDTEKGQEDLFSVANGIAPWTLNDADLQGQTTPGLSVMMQLPSPIDDRDAIDILVSTTQAIAGELGGIVKNNDQELFETKDTNALIDSLYF